MKTITVFLLNLLILLAYVSTGCGQRASVLDEKPDTKKMEQTYFIFNSLEAQGVELDKPLLYGYFFFDKNRSRLENLSSDLTKQHYSLVRLEARDDGDFVLHVEKVEVHSADTLLQRERELRNLASRHRVATYDGWDVGSADTTKALVSNESFRLFMDSKKGDELFDLGIRLYDLEINERAAEVFTECLKQKIKPDVSSFKLAGALFELEKMDEAIFHLEQAVKFNPNYYDAYYNLGAAYYDIGKYKKSIEAYETANKLSLSDDTVFYGIAANQYALGEFPQAIENCKKALKINPNNPQAKALLEQLSKMKNLD